MRRIEGNRLIGASVVAALPFVDPNSYSPALWLDAADTATITDAGAGAVSQWNDKSTNANNATQGTAGLRPITGTRTLNAKNTIDFDATDDSMAFTGISAAASGITVFVVALLDAIAVNHPFLSGAGNGAFQFRTNGATGTISITRQGQATLLTSVQTVTASAAFILEVESSSAGSAIYIGGGAGISNATNPAYTTTTSIIGAGANVIDGQVAEIIVYTRLLSQSEKNNVGNYLEAKWAITWTDV